MCEEEGRGRISGTYYDLDLHLLFVVVSIVYVYKDTPQIEEGGQEEGLNNKDMTMVHSIVCVPPLGCRARPTVTLSLVSI